MGALWQDIRYGIRTVLGSPAFTLVAVATLALGIGANSAVFSIINAVILRPLPYKDPDRIVHVFRRQPPIMTGPISRPDFFEWQAQNQVFQQLAAYYFTTFTLTGGDSAERVPGARVTEDFFPIFGLAPAGGRYFLDSDYEAGGGRVAVIGYDLWQRRFGGDARAIGQTITLNGDAYTLVGVAPSNFTFPRNIGLWTPAVLKSDATVRGSNYLKIIGRPKEGVSIPQAQAQMNQVAVRLAQQYPENEANLTVVVTPILEEQVRNIRAMLLVMLAAVTFVLLIACANVANLSLARATATAREFAIRAALGASRWRIIRQLITESLVLALLGCALGTLLAVWGIHFLVSLAPANIPRINEITIDTRVLSFTVLVSLASAIIFGLAPALHASKVDLNSSLKEGARGAATGGAGRGRTRSALVIAEVSLSLVLLVGAGLLIRSIWRLGNVSPGFDPHNLLALSVSFPYQPMSPADNTDSGRKNLMLKNAGYFTDLQARLARLPGVESVGAINDLPVTGNSGINGDFNVEGRPKYPPGEAPVAEYRWITPSYFHTMGIPLLKGRTFTAADGPDAPAHILINETLARRVFPGEDPLGIRLLVLDDMPHEIVGVVGDARQWGLDRPADSEVYFSYAQVPGPDPTLVLKTGVDPAGLAATVSRAAQEVDPGAPVYGVRTMLQVVDQSVAQRRFNMIVMLTFAGIAQLLAAIGLYGVIAYTVAQRTHEIGIRMALGARKADVLKLVIGRGMLLAGLGIVIGTVGALAVTRLMAGLLFGISPTDPATFITIALVLAVVAFLACYVPARRATKVDPLTALRYE